MDSEEELDKHERAIEATGNFPLLLVPLDGSRMAEAALPLAETVARAQGSVVLLAQVTPLLTWAFSASGGFATPDMYATLLAAEDREAREYLEGVAAPLAARGTRVQILSVRGDPAPTLLDLAQQTPAALVVMTSHGRTGLGRLTLGSVADRLVREGTAPVLLRTFNTARLSVPEEGTAEPHQPTGRENDGAAGDEVRLARAHVPLDGSEVAECAVTLAAKLAGAPLRDIVLVRAVMAHAGSLVVQQARDDLTNARRRLVESLPPGVCTVSTRVLFGSPAKAICDEAAKDADIVIMATRGLTGARRWMLGSVADRVVRDVPVPLLLVRAFAQEPPWASSATRAEETW